MPPTLNTSSATPFAASVGPNMASIAQGEAARAQQQAQFEAELHQREVEHADAKIETERARAENLKANLTLQEKGQQFASQQADKDFERQQVLNEEAARIAKEAQDESMRFSAWMAEQNRASEERRNALGLKLGFLDRTAATKMEHLKLILESQVIRNNADQMIIQKTLDGHQEGLANSVEKLERQANDLEAARKIANDHGRAAGQAAIDSFLIGLNAAQNNTTTGGKIMKWVMDWQNPEVIAKGGNTWNPTILDAAVTGGKVAEGMTNAAAAQIAGSSTNEFVNAATPGIVASLQKSGMTAEQAHKAAGSVSAILNSVMAIGTVATGGHSPEAERLQALALQQVRTKVAESGLSPATVKGLLVQLSEAAQTNAATQSQALASGGGNRALIAAVRNLCTKLSAGAAAAATAVDDDQKSVRTLRAVAEKVKGGKKDFGNLLNDPFVGDVGDEIEGHFQGIEEAQKRIGELREYAVKLAGEGNGTQAQLLNSTLDEYKALLENEIKNSHGPDATPVQENPWSSRKGPSRQQKEPLWMS